MLPEIVKNTLIVGAGSFVGGAARYIVSCAMKGICNGFPWGTLAVNLAGCLLIGLLWGKFCQFNAEDSSAALFMTAGICGGFTTFSTFSKESLTMLQSGNFWAFATYLCISIIAGIALVALGYYITR